MKKIEDFVGHENKHISKIANLLVEAKELLKNNELSKSEFIELKDDLFDNIKIDDLADDLEMRNKLREALSALKEIAGAFL